MSFEPLRVLSPIASHAHSLVMRRLGLGLSHRSSFPNLAVVNLTGLFPLEQPNIAFPEELRSAAGRKRQSPLAVVRWQLGRCRLAGPGSRLLPQNAHREANRPKPTYPPLGACRINRVMKTRQNRFPTLTPSRTAPKAA